MWTREVLGMAFDKSAMRRQLTLMKDMGANALRTSHNCPAPEVLDLCDEMGIVVWDDGTAGRRADENLEEYVTRNLQAFVRRDRGTIWHATVPSRPGIP
jgi:beta-galactosidase